MKNQKSGVIAFEQKAILDLPANATLDISLTNDGNDFTVDTMLPLKAAIPEPLNVEEKEVRRMLHECLELRQAYVYEEEVAPWNQSLDATESEKNRDPFCFCPVEKMDHDFRMEDGVIHVYASENDTTELFPVASATKFFTDVHHILKVISSGNVNSACYHWLRFLEEIGNFWLRKVHHIVIFTTLGKSIHISTIQLA